MIRSHSVNFVIYLLLLLEATSFPGCKKSPTEPQPVVEDRSVLLVNSLSVALVQGGRSTVYVTAKDKDNNREGFSVTSQNPAVASVTSSDSTFTVVGLSQGNTNAFIRGNSGRIQLVPVRVYDPQCLDAGELLIAFVDSFQYRWCDRGSGGTYDGSFYHPLPTGGYAALGSLGFPGYYNPNGLWGVMVVKTRDPESNALARPVDYALVYNDRGSGANDDGSFWAPVPPSGYKAMGLVAQRGYGKPRLDDVVCVRQDLTVVGEPGAFVWNDHGTGATMYLGTWRIEPPVAGPHDNAYLATGTFVGWNSWSPPSVHPVMNVLKVQLPMLAETPYQQYVPRLSGYDPPPPETVPILAREMLVPCTIVGDSLYRNNQMWRICNSPFYRLERQVFYKLLYHNHNQTSITQHNSVLRRSGVTTSRSRSFWNETSVSVTVEAGISIKMFESKVSATVSTSFGYSTQTSVTELQEMEYTSGVDVPPATAVAIWQRYNRYVLKRHNGTTLEPVSAWEFGIESYVTDQYPD